MACTPKIWIAPSLNAKLLSGVRPISTLVSGEAQDSNHLVDQGKCRGIEG